MIKEQFHFNDIIIFNRFNSAMHVKDGTVALEKISVTHLGITPTLDPEFTNPLAHAQEQEEEIFAKDDTVLLQPSSKFFTGKDEEGTISSVSQKNGESFYTVAFGEKIIEVKEADLKFATLPERWADKFEGLKERKEAILTTYHPLVEETRKTIDTIVADVEQSFQDHRAKIEATVVEAIDAYRALGISEGTISMVIEEDFKNLDLANIDNKKVREVTKKKEIKRIRKLKKGLDAERIANHLHTQIQEELGIYFTMSYIGDTQELNSFVKCLTDKVEDGYIPQKGIISAGSKVILKPSKKNKKSKSSPDEGAVLGRVYDVRDISGELGDDDASEQIRIKDPSNGCGFWEDSKDFELVRRVLPSNKMEEGAEIVLRETEANRWNRSYIEARRAHYPPGSKGKVVMIDNPNIYVQFDKRGIWHSDYLGKTHFNTINGFANTIAEELQVITKKSKKLDKTKEHIKQTVDKIVRETFDLVNSEVLERDAFMIRSKRELLRMGFSNHSAYTLLKNQFGMNNVYCETIEVNTR